MKAKAKKLEADSAVTQKTLHNNLNFVGAEAYRLLRANLSFALPGEAEEKCRIIGVTSSIRSEGKSTTAINLAYTLAEAGHRTLLIDGDMRLPSVGKKMNLERSPGLSNYLVAPAKNAQISIRDSGVSDNWKVLTSGDMPPNPNELLASNRMKDMLAKLVEDKEYDYIIVDLPPVTIVSDALVISPMLDGMIVVVRENYTDRKILDEAVRLLAMSSTKILGFVLNDSGSMGKRYGGHKYYNHYSYGYGYGHNAGKAKKG